MITARRVGTGIVVSAVVVGLVLVDWFALLRTKHPITPIADTDTHGVVGQEAGFPRTYVRVAKEDALASWDGSRNADLVHGVRVLRDVVLTNGPFLRVGVDGGRLSCERLLVSCPACRRRGV